MPVAPPGKPRHQGYVAPTFALIVSLGIHHHSQCTARGGVLSSISKSSEGPVLFSIPRAQHRPGTDHFVKWDKGVGEVEKVGGREEGKE